MWSHQATTNIQQTLCPKSERDTRQREKEKNLIQVTCLQISYDYFPFKYDEPSNKNRNKIRKADYFVNHVNFPL